MLDLCCCVLMLFVCCFSLAWAYFIRALAVEVLALMLMLSCCCFVVVVFVGVRFVVRVVHVVFGMLRCW